MNEVFYSTLSRKPIVWLTLSYFQSKIVSSLRKTVIKTKFSSIFKIWKQPRDITLDEQRLGENVHFCSSQFSFSCVRWSSPSGHCGILTPTDTNISKLFCEDASVVFENSVQVFRHHVSVCLSASLSSHLRVQMNRSLPGFFIGIAPC